ncbi:hypothetical protein N7467_003072 [Penicillium canescens]|nr:hypothetical protein N7467_003072 [Penicillium canescens]
MAVERLVRDGIAHIAKINFVAEIEGIRAEALKRSTIISAFKKTGISPFNPSIVLEQIEARNAAQTPSPPRHTSSSPIGTPHTYRHLQKSAHKVDDLIGDLLGPSGITTDEANLVRGFIKGSLTTAAELLQAKRDLGCTKYAQEIEARRRASKNYRLQKGGILEVSEARQMVANRQDNEEVRARKVIEAAQRKAHSLRHRAAMETAKTGRKWRLSGRLNGVRIVESGRQTRVLRKF